MKKQKFFALLIIGILLMSCKTVKPVTDDTFQEVYSKYKKDLVLDGAKSYSVVSGDTLYLISKKFYNNEGFYYPIIMLASSEIVLDPDKIRPGMVLTIPNLEANLENKGAKHAINGVMLDCANIEESRYRQTAAVEIRKLAKSL